MQHGARLDWTPPVHCQPTTAELEGGMMRLGIMATTFARPTLEATLDASAASGVRSVQFDLACAGLPALPAQIDPALCARVAPLPHAA